jgi:hypothetical protein
MRDRERAFATVLLVDDEHPCEKRDRRAIDGRRIGRAERAIIARSRAR